MGIVSLFRKHIMAEKKKKYNTENLKPAKKGEVRNPTGRPRKLIGHINAELEKQGYLKASTADIQAALQTIIQLPTSKIAAIAGEKILYQREDGQVVWLEEGDKYPHLYRLMAKELIGRRSGEALERYLDRGFGRATQKMDHTTDGASFMDLLKGTVNNMNSAE